MVINFLLCYCWWAECHLCSFFSCIWTCYSFIHAFIPALYKKYGTLKKKQTEVHVSITVLCKFVTIALHCLWWWYYSLSPNPQGGKIGISAKRGVGLHERITPVLSVWLQEEQLFSPIEEIQIVLDLPVVISARRWKFAWRYWISQHTMLPRPT